MSLGSTLLTAAAAGGGLDACAPAWLAYFLAAFLAAGTLVLLALVGRILRNWRECD
jgi:hypothetical protein